MKAELMQHVLLFVSEVDVLKLDIEALKLNILPLFIQNLNVL
jgi:hypothetical protein